MYRTNPYRLSMSFPNRRQQRRQKLALLAITVIVAGLTVVVLRAIK